LPEDRLCPHCSAWLCRGDDAWCGYCGRECAQLELYVIPSVLHVGQRPSRLFCRLTNHSCGELALGKVRHPEWIDIETQLPQKIERAGTVGFFASADSEAMEEPDAGELVIETAAGNVSALVMAIEASPEIVCEPESLEAWSQGKRGQSWSRLAFHPAEGELRVRGARLEGISGTVRDAHLAGGVVATAESAAVIEVELDAAGLPVRDFPAQVQLVFDSPHGQAVVERPITVKVRQPPQLRWTGEHEHPEVRYQTDGQKLTLVFQNQHPDGMDGGALNATLVIDVIELTPPPDSGVEVQSLANAAIRIPGGETRRAEFALDLTSLQGQPAKHLVFGLKVQTNLPSIEKSVSLWVEPMPRFEGVVAIDFGSSNTCCAFAQPGGEPELLALDEEEEVSPTIARYIDMTTSTPRIEAGSSVKRNAAVSLEFAASVADGLKQKLREPRQEISIRPDHPNEWTTRTAGDAAADYLKHIRHVAEIRKSAVFQEFILTHPARCPIRQHRRLRKALLDAFGSSQERVSYLSEPIAALIPFLADRARRDVRPEYTVASFDIGGGTTDIAVIRVAYEYPGNWVTVIVPEIRYCSGAHFGGENLTDFLVAEMEKNCEGLLQAARPGAKLVSEQTAAAASVDIRRNRFRLRDAAESFKVSLNPRKRNLAPTGLELRIHEEDGRPNDFNFQFGQILHFAGRNLETEFRDYTRACVNELAQMLERALKDPATAFSVLHLSGKTSLLGAVRNALELKFPKIEIAAAPDPKECVVKGACLSRSMQMGGLRLRLPDTMQRMTSSIGVFSPHSPYFHPVLVADTPIPPQGLSGEVKQFWSGKEPVVLWENLAGEGEQIDLASAPALLDKLGTWQPERTVELQEDQRWTLRISIHEFLLSVSAIGPRGETIAFHPMHGKGD